MDTPGPNPAYARKRHVTVICRLVAVFLTTLCLAFCAGFWLTRRAEEPAVLGWYGVQWFAMALAANAVAVLCTVGWVRCLWSGKEAQVKDRRRISFRKRLAFIAVLWVLVLVGVELGLRGFLRAAEVRDTVKRIDPDIHYHAHLQMTRRICVDGEWVRAFRGRTPQRGKSTGFRIVCLGGSTTWGTGVEPAEAWPMVLERILRDDGYDIEVINAGFPWYTTADSLVNYSLLLRYYQPDAVVIMHGVNDLCRSFPQPREPPFEWDYGSYQGPMRAILQTVRRRGLENVDRHLGDLVRSSAVYRFVCATTGIDRNYYSALRSGRTAHRRQGFFPSTPAPFPRRTDMEVDVGLESFPSLESFRDHLGYLVQLCRQDGSQVVLATQAHVYARSPTTHGPNPAHFIRNLTFHLPDGELVSSRSVREAMRAVRQTTLEIARCHAVPVADAEAAINAKPALFLDDFHLTVEGNTIVAETVAGTLRPMLGDLPRSTREPITRDPLKTGSGCGSLYTVRRSGSLGKE